VPVVVVEEGLDGTGMTWGSLTHQHWLSPPGMSAPTLVASRTALPPKGVVLAWGGPALRTMPQRKAAPQREHEELLMFS